MTAWQTVAEGLSFDDLETLIKDQVLPPGSKIKIEMDTNFPSYFDAPWAEAQFKQSGFIPSGTTLMDVWGVGAIWPWSKGKAYAELIVNEDAVSAQASRISIAPVILFGVLATIAKWGLIILVAGFVIAALVSFIRISVKVTKTVEEAAPWLIWAVLIGGGVFAGYLGYKYLTKREERGYREEVK